ncbi:RHS repeat-associated core domain-containing protein [Chryseobacterium salviniae]|uniref:RHS repeat-associated core domain-containing protein n=1 Tax=Chryseobacterium salviniae TaxID=3101750 RepID=A0ABU6HSK8_9FLAO|nr:RHS repeat-associated core domain-containing protein [Chryseobacterium sp. T9W2-O]MEC3876031.1 RHS repeat-associated core domain-containing protein [Chryseobacterium sp. T9W2-O]
MKRILLIAFAIITGFTQAQVKKTQTKQKLKVEKKWINPVKLTKEERNRPYMDEVLKTKDSLTPQEAERRRKNIAIGNPFAKYGVYPKIATLSKGKYLEFHDTDSIVVIGSVRFNTKRDNIIEVREVDLSDPDAQPIGDTHGRWMSPDPLSEEFPDWSPYNYAVNNPINNIDPTGLAAESVKDDYKLLKNGQVELIKKTNDKFDRLFSTNDSGKVTSQSTSITVDKKNANDVSIIGQLSQTNDGKLMDYFGKAMNPFFSEGFTNNLDTAYNLYNFLDNNTDSGIEFSLANYNVNGKDNFQIATMHSIDGSKIFSNKFSQDNLVWSLHNHDGKIGLDYKNIGNQWSADKSTMYGIFRSNQSKGLGDPRFFTVNDNNRMIEISRTGANTKQTYPFNVQFLKNLKRK